MSRIEDLERRVQQDPASIVFGALAEEYRRADRLDEAIAVCRAGLERHPSYLSARVTLGRALQSLGQLDDARAEFERVIEVAPDNLAAIRALAELHGDAPETPVSAPPAPPVAPPAPIPARPDASVESVPVAAVAAVAPAEPTEPAEPGSSALSALESWLAVIERERRDAPERL